ncbi:uncharacterized protein LOC118700308 [Molothrus ater]|uniref:uncharacterized protein LOC118700308 n=1 Tax=Molothrus ater TaxID=84834 RepID=UPI00174CE843|nr:uncharacterized protein LOC118700308 [Molothrus ater]
MEQKSMQMGPYPKGSNGFVPDSDAGKLEMPDMGTDEPYDEDDSVDEDDPVDKDDLDSQPIPITGLLEDGEDEPYDEDDSVDEDDPVDKDDLDSQPIPITGLLEDGEGLKENLQQCHRSCSVLPFFADEPYDEDDSVDEDDPVDKDDLDSQPIPITGLLEDGEGVSAGRTFPGPLVDVARKPSSHRRGPLRKKKKPGGGSKSLKETQHLEQKWSDVDSQRDAAGTSTRTDNIWRRVFCWERACLIKLTAIVAGAALCLVICCAGIWYCWKRKWCSSASSEEEPKNSDKVLPTSYSSYPRLPLSALPWLQHRYEAFPKPPPPKRDPLPLSPLVLFPGQE